MAYFKKGDPISLGDADNTILLIKEHIGSGNQGDVYIAYDNVSNSYVAVKHCYGRFVQKKGTFYQKIKAMTRHRAADPRLCWPLKVSPLTKDECFVFTMPLLEGYRSFVGLITNEDKVNLKQKMEILRQAAEVLEALHRENFIYGDISENNLLYKVNPDGSVDVRFIDCDNITLPGFSLGVQGTGKYRAPELLIPDPGRKDGLPQPPSIQSDCYAFQVMAFRVLLRRHPLDGALYRDKRIDDYEAFLEHFGRNPRFIFDGTSNAPSENIIRKWEALPQPMRSFFRDAFRQEALHNKYARPDMGAFIHHLNLSVPSV